MHYRHSDRINLNAARNNTTPTSSQASRFPDLTMKHMNMIEIMARDTTCPLRTFIQIFLFCRSMDISLNFHYIAFFVA